MNSAGHLAVSVVKSILRIASCTWSIVSSQFWPIAIGFLLAECLGIVEELVDKR